MFIVQRFGKRGAYHYYYYNNMISSILPLMLGLRFKYGILNVVVIPIPTYNLHNLYLKSIKNITRPFMQRNLLLRAPE